MSFWWSLGNLDEFIPSSMLASIESAPVDDGAQQKGFNSQAVGEAYQQPLCPDQQGFNGQLFGGSFQQQLYPEQQNTLTFDNQFQDSSLSTFDPDATWSASCVLHAHAYPVAFKDCPYNVQELQFDNLFEGLEGTENTLGDTLAGMDNCLGENSVGNGETLTEQWVPPAGNGHAATPQPPQIKQEMSPISPGLDDASASASKTNRPSHKSIVSAPRGVTKPKAKRSTANRTASLKCEACEKVFSLKSSGHDGVHCPRCAKIIRKNRLGPPVFSYDPAISSFDDAWQSVYPDRPPLDYKGDGEDDWALFTDKENEWVDRLIEYANVPYTETDGPGTEAATRTKGDHDYFLKQQETYNKKPFNESSKDVFTNDEVNVRMRFLFQAIMRYHAGGHVVYPASGDNRGYGEDRTLKCSERLEMIGCMMGTDKRILMNVIEGRGVLGFVANPRKYAGRKTMNKSCNETKRQMIERGETLAPQEAVRVRMERRMRNRKRAAGTDSPGTEELDGEEGEDE